MIQKIHHSKQLLCFHKPYHTRRNKVFFAEYKLSQLFLSKIVNVINQRFKLNSVFVFFFYLEGQGFYTTNVITYN